VLAAGAGRFFGARQALHQVRQLCLWHFGHGCVLATGASALLVLGKLYIVFSNCVYGTLAMDAFLQLVQGRFLVLCKFYFVFNSAVHGTSAIDTFLLALQRRFW